MSAELEVLLTNKRWQGIFSAILSQYWQFSQLVSKAAELEIIVAVDRGLYCHHWGQYQLTFSEYIRKRRKYLPWFIKTIPEDILIYKTVDSDDPSWRKHGELRLESNLTAVPWRMDVIGVDLESLGSITGIVEWLQEVCAVYKEAIGAREAELQVSNEYFDSLADVAADSAMSEQRGGSSGQ